MKQVVCDVCDNQIVSATETHTVLYADNSARRIDVCRGCVEVLRSQSRGHDAADRFIRAVLWPRKAPTP